MLSIHLLTPPLFQLRELHAIREDVKNTVRVLKKAGDNASALENEGFCQRGVERNGSMSERKRRTRNMIEVLLDEQNNQRKMGIYDPKGLQVRASVFSKAATERALRLAKLDEEEALEISAHASLANTSSKLSVTIYESNDGSDDESKIERVGRCGPKLDIQHQQKNTSLLDIQYQQKKTSLARSA